MMMPTGMPTIIASRSAAIINCSVDGTRSLICNATGLAPFNG
jgi:hypothetical protein